MTLTFDIDILMIHDWSQPLRFGIPSRYGVEPTSDGRWTSVDSLEVIGIRHHSFINPRHTSDMIDGKSSIMIEVITWCADDN